MFHCTFGVNIAVTSSNIGIFEATEGNLDQTISKGCSNIAQELKLTWN